MSATMLYPSKKAAADADDPGRGAPLTVRHDLRGDELPAMAEVRAGAHFLNAARCDGCRLILRDYWG